MAKDSFDTSTFGSLPAEDATAGPGMGLTATGGLASSAIIDSGTLSLDDGRAIATRAIGAVVFGWASTTVLIVVTFMSWNGIGLTRSIIGSPFRDLFTSPWMIRPSLLREFRWPYELGGTYLLSPLLLATIVVGLLGLVVAVSGRFDQQLRGLVFSHAVLTGVLISSMGTASAPSLAPNLVRSVAVPALAFLGLFLLKRPSEQVA